MSHLIQDPVQHCLRQPDILYSLCCQFSVGSDGLNSLLLVNKPFNKIVCEIYRQNVEKIFRIYANKQTPLNCIISIVKSQHNDPIPLSSFTVSKCHELIFVLINHSSVFFPNRPLNFECVPRMNGAIEDYNLKSIWKPISQAIAVDGKPAIDASAKEIRLWMHANANELQAINDLSLSGKALTCVPPEIALLTGLQRLNLSYNQLTELPPCAFNELDQLRGLFLDNNLITELSPCVFNRLVRLQGLTLNDNQIKELPLEIFNGLHQLGALSLNNNQLRELSVGVFKGLDSLFVLTLTNNPLINVSSATFEGLGQMSDLYLDECLWDHLADLKERGILKTAK